jgi:hypothetical protein
MMSLVITFSLFLTAIGPQQTATRKLGEPSKQPDLTSDRRAPPGPALEVGAQQLNAIRNAKILSRRRKLLKALETQRSFERNKGGSRSVASEN